jgi:hypothetical protein
MPPVRYRSRCPHFGNRRRGPAGRATLPSEASTGRLRFDVYGRFLLDVDRSYAGASRRPAPLIAGA